MSKSDRSLSITGHEPSNSGNRENPFPEVIMPAMPPLGLITAIEDRIRNWRHRRMLQRLLKYDEFLLEDVGHHRADLVRASRLPLRVDPLKKLVEWREQSQGRSGGVALPLCDAGSE
ncbi:hypothetical protein [Marinobacter xestospongiae]|uniref:DUF1127 domain-containing protein n=1 Tax=Marinobacter xestospongiae TaxID=994319 RepID=A0ABU3VU62_9GAMM|nr:hypothetical protein [Marinobacter xestospongiae]MDV2077799.1 hypothetical protein [Marinobacter xestospongiae]